VFRIILLSLVAGLAFGLAVAAGEPIREDVVFGVDEAEVKQDITVEIPPRYALHLTATEWVLDLADLEGQACFLVPKNVGFKKGIFKDFQMEWLLGDLDLLPTENYPAFIQKEPGGEVRKGSLICLFRKVLQKFTNVPDWQLEVEFAADKAGFGYFLLSDFIDEWRFFTLGTRGTSADTSRDVRGTTGGWLDNTLVEGFWFDGTEVAGDYEITITFTLTPGAL